MSGTDPSSPIRVPSVQELRSLQSIGATVGYRGFHIYLRYRAVLRLIEGRRFGSAISVGCGFGIFDRLLPEDMDFVGIDPGVPEIEFATRWATAARARFRYRCGRLEPGGLAQASFDLVLLSEVLEHMPEDECRDTLAEVVRILAPGGTLIVTVPNRLRLRNRVRSALRLPPALMDKTHIREYDMAAARSLLEGLPVEVRAFQSAVLFFPLERAIGAVIPPESAARDWMTRAAPSLGSHFLMRAERLSP